MTKPLRILCSQAGRVAIEAEVTRLIGERGCAFVSPSQIQDASGGCDIAFVSRDVTGRSTKHEVLPETAQFYDALLNSQYLQWVHVHSAGVDRPVYQALIARGVRVTGSVGANATVVAQTALTGLLMLSRRMPLLMQSQRERQWQPLHGALMPRDLHGQRITIVGWGAIGQQLAQYARMLGLQITVARHSDGPAGSDLATVTYKELHEVLPQTDWLVLACPSTVQTHQLIHAQALAALPLGAHLINVARGDVVDEQALIAALQTGKLAGAYLDVFAHEPLAQDSPLWRLPNVIVSPHCAGFSSGNEARVATLFLDNFSRYLSSTLQPHRATVKTI
jgi:D-2-hydroxyacid dehydrogenase (NADP+)